MKKMIIAAGTGFLGTVITSYFKSKVEEIVILTRGTSNTIDNIRHVHWDARTIGSWISELENADVLINMTGKSVDCRYTKKNKELILKSRTESTGILHNALQQCIHPPKVWLNSSTATIYRHSLNKEMDEVQGEYGTGFSVAVAKAWETAFFKSSIPNVRKVALRTSIVLGKNGGALRPIVNLVKIGMGGRQGSGKQKFSWIHEIDFARSIEYIITQTAIDGTVNIVAPKPVTNAKLMQQLQKTLRRPFGIPLPKFLLEIGARIIQTETELIIKSRNVVPKKLIDHGFQFNYATLDIALQDLTTKKT